MEAYVSQNIRLINQSTAGTHANILIIRNADIIHYIQKSQRLLPDIKQFHRRIREIRQDEKKTLKSTVFPCRYFPTA